MKKQNQRYKRPGWFSYTLTRIVSFFVSRLVYGLHIVRNELRAVKGPCVVIANHQSTLDFVNLIGASPRRMTFVISSSFYQSLPVKRIMDRMHVIPKQQFQTEVSDMKKMKAVIESGNILVIYPAGLMCEDGLSTPIPQATYKFLRWLRTDVYMARTYGSYLVMPKWSGRLRLGKTELDIYKLFTKEELAEMSEEQIKEKTDGALLFDAYREQESRKIRYKNGKDIRGLEHVLYMCPACCEEFTMEVTSDNALYCTNCGYEAETDEFGFLHTRKGSGPEIRYVSDWSLSRLKERLEKDPETVISADTRIDLIDPKKNRYVEAGNGTVSIGQRVLRLKGQIRETPLDISVPVAGIPTLPFSPGKRIELQDGPQIYRCVLNDGRMAMKLINTLKAFQQIRA